MVAANLWLLLLDRVLHSDRLSLDELWLSYNILRTIERERLAMLGDQARCLLLLWESGRLNLRAVDLLLTVALNKVMGNNNRAATAAEWASIGDCVQLIVLNLVREGKSLLLRVPLSVSRPPVEQTGLHLLIHNVAVVIVDLLKVTYALKYIVVRVRLIRRLKDRFSCILSSIRHFPCFLV